MPRSSRIAHPARRGRLATATVLASACALVLTALSPRLAIAEGYQETVTVDPDPTRTGDECTITIGAVDTTENSRSDVATVKAALQAALAGSADMRTKTAAACAKQGRSVLITVVRDSAAVTGGVVLGGAMLVDLGDLEAVGTFAEGAADDVKKVADGMLTRTLAHEMDHLRDGPNDRAHRDPNDGEGTRGPAVDDENLVAAEMGLETVRRNYARSEPDPMVMEELVSRDSTDFEVNGRSVRVNLTKWRNRNTGTTAPAGTTPQRRNVPRSTLDRVPRGKCSGGYAPCWDDVGADDTDLDAVPDAGDNCIGFPNFGQLDLDGDGLGAPCDDDDDGDGVARGLEEAFGSSDSDVLSLPEHGDIVGACDDGLDNDGDGLLDEDDASCGPPDESPTTLPGATAAGAEYPRYRSAALGGVPDATDGHAASATLVLDGETIALEGHVAFDRGVPLAKEGAVEMPFAVAGLALRGVSSSRGPVSLAVVSHAPGAGGAVVAGPDGAYPADVSMQVVLMLSDLEGATATATDRLALAGSAARWPLWGESFASSGDGVALLRNGAPVAHVDSLALTLRGGDVVPGAFADPEGDVDQANGDPSIDITSSSPFYDDGSPWVRLETAGSWPPPDVYSWYCGVSLLDGEGETLAAFTTELHDGVEATYVDVIDASQVVYAVEARGFRVLFDVALEPATYALDCGMLRTPDAGFGLDGAGPYPFDAADAPFPL